MKNIATILCLFIIQITVGQNFQGKAVYKTSSKIRINLSGKNGMQLSDADKEKMQERMRKQFQKTFVLSFNKEASVYKEEEKLSAPTASLGGGNIMVKTIGLGGGNDVLYKNTKKGQYLNQTEVMGKRFLIKDKLRKYDWKLTGETKNIGKYTCYKATYTREETRTNMSFDDGEIEEKKEKVEVVTTAWYTPEIPVSNGPRDYHGLPGLILEVKDGNNIILCSEIVLNPKEKIEIIAPRKGKKVTQEQYGKIMQKKMKETMENFKSRRKGGRNVQISIGG